MARASDAADSRRHGVTPHAVGDVRNNGAARSTAASQKAVQEYAVFQLMEPE
jgi:hypothetical protein